MFKVSVNRGGYVFESSDEDALTCHDKLAKIVEIFEESKVFSLKNYSENPANFNSEKVKQNNVASKQDMIDWLRAQPEHHSKSWIAKNGPFSNAVRLLTQMERAGDVVLAQTTYEPGPGRVGYMQAYYLPGDLVPEQWDKSPDENQEILLEWLSNNQTYVPRYIERNCGIPELIAQRTLTALIVSKRVIVKLDAKGKGRVYLPKESELPRNTDDK